MKRGIDRDLLLDLCYDDAEDDCGWSFVDSQVSDTWRWGNVMDLVIRSTEDGSLWGFTYQVTTGDEGRNHIRDEPQQVELYSVVATTKTVYEPGEH